MRRCCRRRKPFVFTQRDFGAQHLCHVSRLSENLPMVTQATRQRTHPGPRAKTCAFAKPPWAPTSAQRTNRLGCRMGCSKDSGKEVELGGDAPQHSRSSSWLDDKSCFLEAILQSGGLQPPLVPARSERTARWSMGASDTHGEIPHAPKDRPPMTPHSPAPAPLRLGASRLPGVQAHLCCACLQEAKRAAMERLVKSRPILTTPLRMALLTTPSVYEAKPI